MMTLETLLPAFADGRIWTMRRLAEHLHTPETEMLPLLTRANGFTKHGEHWGYNPLVAELFEATRERSMA